MSKTLMDCTDEQLASWRSQFVPESGGVPVRFMKDGRAMDIITGELWPKGINVINQPAYWKFTKDTAKEIAKELGVKAVF